MDKRVMSIAAGVLAALLILSQSLFTVRETEYAINLQFGKLVEFDYQPGLHFVVPFAQEIKKFEKRVMTRFSNFLISCANGITKCSPG